MRLEGVRASKMAEMTPLLREATPADGPERRTRRAVANGGRILSVALPSYGAVAASGAINPRGLALGLAFTGVWLFALSTSFTASRKELLALGILPAAMRGAAIGLVGVSTVEFWVGEGAVSPLAIFASCLAVLVLFTCWESYVRRRLERPRRVVIVGTGRNSVALVREINGAARLPFEVVGVVDDGSTSAAGPPPAPGLGDVARLPAILEQHRPDLVVLAVERDRPTTFGHLLDSASTGFRVLELPQFYEHALGRVPVRDLPRAWFMSVLHLYQRPHSRVAKRVFDVVVASFGLLLMLPSLLLTAVFVRRSQGPIILRQTRIGEHGKPFTIYKFRTMRADAEAPGQALWASDRDPRITRIGFGLRAMRLDELPQLWNVLRGDMSIVGPRPERPEFLSHLEEEVPYWTRRHLIKPGVTGWAQIRRGYTADVDGSTDKLSFDLWYLRHRSLLVDMAICLETVKMLLFGAARAGEEQQSPRSKSVRRGTRPSPVDGFD
jgi:exopolysaccharide biosynthesis polyprenyl glycosylphosphotransferase